MPTDFAPHDLTSNISHSPYNLTCSSQFSAAAAGWKVLDGVWSLSTWIGILSGVEWLTLDLDSVSEYTEFTPHDLTSNTSHSPIVVTRSSAFNSGLESWNTLDGGTGYWIGTGSGSDWLKYDFGSGNSYVLGRYDVKVNSIPEPARAPKAWTLQGSNDDSTWTTIDTVINQTGWESGEVRRFICDDVSTAYRYFQIVITSNNGDATYTQIQEVYFHSFAAGSPARKICGSYDIKAYANADRDPKDWTLKGSNDGVSWDTLDTVTGQTGWSAGVRTFTCDVVTTAYRYFKLDITANNGDATYTEISEFYLYEYEPPAGLPAYGFWCNGSAGLPASITGDVGIFS